MDDIRQQEIVKQLEQLAQDLSEGKVSSQCFISPDEIGVKFPGNEEVVHPNGVVHLLANNRVELGTALPVFANEDYLHAGNLLRLAVPTTQRHVEDIYTAFVMIGASIRAILFNPVDLTLFNANVIKKAAP